MAFTRITVAAALVATVVRAPGPWRQAPSATSGTAAAQSAFRFQNNFWVNLHHVLRGEARRRGVRAPLRIDAGKLPSAEGETWTKALDVYARYAQRNLLFDAELIAINNALADADTVPRAGRGVPPAVLGALTAAAPIYRAHYWSEQRELNDRWIAAVRPMLAEHGLAMIASVETAYGVVWPREPIVVDACAEAGPTGGYTTDGPPGTAAHTVIEAGNREYQGDMAFEMLFHEASHARAIGGRPFDAIRAEAARRHVTAPPDLYHVVVFYTAGELARRALGKVGDEHYMPYAYRYGVYERGWQPLRDAVVRDWQPHLDGHRSLEDAIAALVRDTATSSKF